MKQQVKNGIITGLAFSITVMFSVASYAVWTGLNAEAGDTLLIDKWNELVDKVDGIYTNGSGNVGIGTANPSEVLDVNGFVKANDIKLSNFSVSNLVGSYSNSESTSSESIINITESGIYLVSGSYLCRSTSGGGRYPHERFYINGYKVHDVYGSKLCGEQSYANRDSKTTHNIILDLNAGDELKFLVSGWSVNYYKSSRVFASKIFNK